jgi:transcriptional regulator of acetoin/glycerol metabolism
MTFARPTSTHCNGKQMQAAAALDIDRVTLHNKLKGWKYGWKWITAEA